MRIATIAAVAIFMTGGLTAAERAHASVTHYELNIPRQPLDTALKDLAQQTGLQVGRFSDAIKGDTPVGPLTGNYSAEQALKTLLAPTRLTYRSLNDRAIIVLRPEDITQLPTESSLSTAEAVAAQVAGEGVGDANSSGDERQPPGSRLHLARAAQGGDQTDSAVTNSRSANSSQANSAGTGESNSPVTLEEVVVTATGRQERSFDVPLALSVTQGAELARANIQDVVNIGAVDPGLTVRQYGPGINSFIIRGIVSQGQPTTGVYYDNAPLVGGYQTNGSGDSTPPLRLIDVDRIEILKGPQGTLFGQGSMAGTVRIMTVKPDLDGFSGKVSAQGGATAGGNPLYDNSLILNVPITSTIGIRAVGWAENGGGFIDHQPLFSKKVFSDSNNTDLLGERISALWRPSDTFEFVTKYTHQTIQADDGNASSIGSQDYFSLTPTFEPYRDTMTIFDGTATYDALGGEFSATAARTRYFRERRDDGTDAGVAFTHSNAPLNFVETADYKGTTGEIRYTSKWQGPVQLVTGAFYQNDNTPTEEVAIVADPFSGQIPCTGYFSCLNGGFLGGGFASPGQGRSDYLRNHKTAQQAYYAQTEYKLTSTITATAGLRYFRARLSDDAQFLRTIAEVKAGTTGIGPVTDQVSTIQSKTTYNASLSWEPTPTVNTYLRAASGFRIGGLNNYQSAYDSYGIVIPARYSPDSLNNYEIGAKTSLLDRRLLVDGALYYIDWSNEQLPGSDPNGIVTYIINAGKTHVKGVELNFRSLPTDHLSVDAGINYVSSRLASDLPAAVVAAGTPGRSGDLVPGAPVWSGSALAEYHQPVLNNWEGYLGGSLSYKGNSYNRFESDPLRLSIPSSTLVGLRTGMRTERTDIGLYVDNLFNDFDVNGIFQTVGGTGVPSRYFVGRPRTISIRVVTNL